MAAAKCCDKGFVWEGETVGVEGKCGGLDAYISKPEGPTTKAVILIADIFGWGAKNPRLIADAFAKRGYLAVLPDFFHGNPWVGELDMPRLMEWLGNFKKEAVLAELDAICADLKGLGITKLGTEGFCWGGLYSAILAKTGQVDSAIIAHGSFITKEDVEAIAKPTLWLCASNDMMITPEFLKEIESVMATKPFPSLIKVYPNTEHGFSVRGDKSDPYISQMATDALDAAIAWLDASLSEE